MNESKMNENKVNPINSNEVETITYDEAFKKLGAFIQKTRKEEREKQLAEEGTKEHE